MTFGDRLSYADDGGTVHLIHAPGHSEDSLVVFLAESRLLLGGDTVEWPLPNFGQRDGAEEWIRTLRQLKQLPVDLIVPAHGPAMDKQIIDANERYIRGVYEAVAAAKASGAGRGRAGPAGRALPRRRRRRRRRVRGRTPRQPPLGLGRGLSARPPAGRARRTSDGHE